MKKKFFPCLLIPFLLLSACAKEEGVRIKEKPLYRFSLAGENVLKETRKGAKRQHIRQFWKSQEQMS